MYRIGEFSYLFKVTIKTLRHYDKIDLFKPAFIDPYTGYRYYNEEQKCEFSNILKLKNLNFSLEEIKQLKDNLSKETLNKKILDLQEEKLKISSKIEELEKISKGDNNMKDYIIGIANDVHLTIWGKKYILEKRDNKLIEDLFKEVESKLEKENINCDNRKKVLITLEVGYKEENIELFIGYEIWEKELDKKLMNKRFNKDEKLEIEPFGYPRMDYLVALDVLKDDTQDIYKSLIEYAQINKLQIIGPFMEIYKNDTKDVYVLINDLNRELVYNVRNRKKLNKIYEEYKKDNSIFDKYFKDNKEIIGTWEIKEILPNIDFNPNIQKSIPDTKFKELTIYENGKTNYDNVKWTGNYLIIEANNNITTNLIKILKEDDKEYLEIRMNDLVSVYPNAAPVSYIYERSKN